jgi:hypothetical protein
VTLGWAEGVKFASAYGLMAITVVLLAIGALSLNGAVSEAIAGGRGSQLNGELDSAD